jgi:hypothetical protein
VSDIELMREALRRLPSYVLNNLTMRKLLQEKAVLGTCPTAQHLRAQQIWERSCDAGR